MWDDIIIEMVEEYDGAATHQLLLRKVLQAHAGAHVLIDSGRLPLSSRKLLSRWCVRNCSTGLNSLAMLGAVTETCASSCAMSGVGSRASAWAIEVGKDTQRAPTDAFIDASRCRCALA